MAFHCVMSKLLITKSDTLSEENTVCKETLTLGFSSAMVAVCACSTATAQSGARLCVGCSEPAQLRQMHRALVKCSVNDPLFPLRSSSTFFSTLTDFTEANILILIDSSSETCYDLTEPSLETVTMTITKREEDR